MECVVIFGCILCKNINLERMIGFNQESKVGTHRRAGKKTLNLHFFPIVVFIMDVPICFGYSLKNARQTLEQTKQLP